MLYESVYKVFEEGEGDEERRSGKEESLKSESEVCCVVVSE